MPRLDTRADTFIRVLLVEDDDADALIVQDQLEELAAEIDVAHVRTLGEALPRAGEADCVVVDLGLPDAMGLEALHRLTQAVPGLAVVVLTGLDDPQAGLDALAAGAQDYLVKGRVDGELLFRTVRYAIERRRSEQTQRELTLVNQLAAENRRLERGLLPRPVTVNPALVLGSSYRPGRKRALLGGDFFDVVEDAQGTIHLVIGDVSGHGPDEAALGVALRITWRALVLAGVRGDELLNGLQEILGHERHDPDVFATVCSVCVDPGKLLATLQLAGHPAPILLTPHTGPVRLEHRAGLPLGVLDDATWASREIELPPSWGLLLHTDGLTERVMTDGDRVGDARLLAAVAMQQRTHDEWLNHPQALADAIIATVGEQSTDEVLDDTAVLLAGWRP